LHNFAKFNDPIIAALRNLGVDAELHGKSDIFAGGKKISGNAQYASKGRMFSHGTLLFETNLEHLLKAINPRGTVIESNAVQSIRNFVTNIRELLPQDMTIDELRQTLLHALFGGDVVEYELTAVDWQQIDKIADGRFRSWNWNVGHTPKFNIQTSQQLPIGKIDAHISVDNGHIQALKVYGAFIGEREVAELESELRGVDYREGAVRERLQSLNLDDYFGDLSPDNFLQLLSL
jgi:lipoate-protein ligase A